MSLSPASVRNTEGLVKPPVSVLSTETDPGGAGGPAAGGLTPGLSPGPPGPAAPLRVTRGGSCTPRANTTHLKISASACLLNRL